MLRYVIRRLLLLPGVLFCLITVSFFIMRLAPGSPFTEERQLSPEIAQVQRAYWGFDQPLPVQYARYLGNLIQGDLGFSMQQRGRSVVEIISTYLPVSVELGLWALALALALGLGTGIIAGLRQNSFLDYSGMSLALIGISVPTFVVGPLLILLFARKLHLLDSGGWAEWHHVLLPAVTLALPFASRVARLARAGMLEIIGQDFIRTARAKGMPGRRIVLVHALRGAILPVVSFLGPGMAQLLTGSLVVEQIFGIPGLGNEFVTTALNRDYPVVLGTVITYGTLQIVFNLAVDLLYGVLDPRIRYA